MPTTKTSTEYTERPPIIAVMGHIDHGKSKLLDYIRETNIVDTESGGITQHISAYEVHHKNSAGIEKKITFLDTPGHEAFSAMRARGVRIADIAILVVSAEDGVKAQTLEAYSAIKKSTIPYIIAINKIDKPNANAEKTKNELAEHEIYLEGHGGDVPYVEISAMTGQGVSDLLDMMLLVAELEELKGDKDICARGFVLESNIDPRRGISATLVITDGTLKKGMSIAAGDSCSPVRAIENFAGIMIDEASFSSPVRITGFDKVPEIGSDFTCFHTKKEAGEEAGCNKKEICGKTLIGSKDAEVIIPLVIKADVLGTIEAIKKELKKIPQEKVCLHIIHEGVGDITENDVTIASGSPNSLIIGFRVRLDSKSTIAIEKTGIPVETFAIIYKITDYVEKIVRKRMPKERVEETAGTIKIFKIFSHIKNKQVVGGAVTSGLITRNIEVKIIRNETVIGNGNMVELQQQKIKVDQAEKGMEIGMMVESSTEIAPGDILEGFHIVEK